MSDDPNKFKIRKLQAEILGLGSVIRQLRQPGMHDAATQLLRCRKRAVPRMSRETHPWESIGRAMVISEEGSVSWR